MIHVRSLGLSLNSQKVMISTYLKGLIHGGGGRGGGGIPQLVQFHIHIDILVLEPDPFLLFHLVIVFIVAVCNGKMLRN